jgi:nucleoside 2-deoxyribosyltransferase
MGKLRGNITYLAGSMDNDPTGGNDWRDEITPFLKSKGVGVFNPCHKPMTSAVEDGKVRENISQLKKEKRFAEIKEIMREIVYTDLRMVDKCDFMILNIEPDVHMCGSYHESNYGIMEHKPIIILCRKGVEFIPNWLYGIIDIETMFDSVGGVCEYLDKIDSGAIVPSYRKWKFFDFSMVFGTNE